MIGRTWNTIRIVAALGCLLGQARLGAQPAGPSRAEEIFVKRELLQAAFQKDFKAPLNLQNHRDINRAVNRWLAHDGRAAYVGRWNAEVRTDNSGVAYGVTMIDPDSVLKVKLDTLRAGFKKHFKRDLDANSYREVQQAVNLWVAANKRGGLFGFWNAETGKDAAGNEVYGVALLRPVRMLGVKLDELRDVFKKDFNRALDGNNYLEVSLAVHRWLMANKLGELCGLWNAMEDKDAAGNTVYGVVLLPPVENAALAYVANSTIRVCQLTGDFDRALGKPTLNRTDKRFGVEGTDLGSSFEHKEKLYFLFGDTWGRPGDRDVLAWTSSDNPYKLTLEFPTEKEDGKWRPLTVPKVSQGEFEVPSGGIALGDTMYVVCTTDHTEKRVMGRSVLARSRDDGGSFTKLYDLSRAKFINVSLWLADDWLYIYGSGTYRKSNVYLARVRPKDIENKAKLEYFTGAPDDTPRWSPTEAEAVPLFEHRQVGEFSVSYLRPVNRYVMLYNSLKPRGIMLRDARDPWGPWSDPTVIFDPGREPGYGAFMHISNKDPNRRDALSDRGREDVWGGEYGPYVMSRYTNGGHWACRIFYTMSTWNPYQVVVMQTDLALR